MFVNNQLFRTPFLYHICRQLCTVPKASLQAVGKKRFRLPTETDVNKLMNYCCGANYFKDGEEIKLKDDKDYPDWLWELPLKPPRLHELDPNTKEYWEKAAKVGRQRENKLRSLSMKNKILVDPHKIDLLELKHRRRFRALAKYHYNAGHDIIEHHERDDIWNMHLKDRYYIEPDSKKFYPGIDTKNPQEKRKFNFIRHKKIGHFGL